VTYGLVELIAATILTTWECTACCDSTVPTCEAFTDHQYTACHSNHTIGTATGHYEITP
jgi:hypothetical protein